MRMSHSPWGMHSATERAASYSAPSAPTQQMVTQQRASYAAPATSSYHYATTRRLGDAAEPPPPRPMNWGLAVGWAAVVAAAVGIFHGVTQEGPWFAFDAPRRNGKSKKRRGRRSSRLRANTRRKAAPRRGLVFDPVKGEVVAGPLPMATAMARAAEMTWGAVYDADTRKVHIVYKHGRVYHGGDPGNTLMKNTRRVVSRNAHRGTGSGVSAAAGGIATIRNLGISGAPAASKLGQKRYDMLVRRGPGLYRISAGRSPSVIKFKTASPQGAITNTRIAASKSGESHWLVKVFPSGRPKAVVIRYITGDGKSKFRIEEYAAQAYERVAGYARRAG